MNASELLKLIKQIESSNGQDLDHPMVQHGLQAGTTAVGSYGLMPNTVKEVLHRMKMAKEQIPPELKQQDHVAEALTAKPELEDLIANKLMNHILSKPEIDDDKAAYMWNMGHNRRPADISPETLDANPYVGKFRALKSKLGAL